MSVHVELTREPIVADDLLRAVARDDAGAVALFLGTVRDHHDGRAVAALGYEAYEPLARAEMQRLADETLARFPVGAVAVTHRIGDLAIGDASVAVAVASAHRDAAFRAARFLIDTLKRTVPIWKRERYADGEVWIEGDRKTPAG